MALKAGLTEQRASAGDLGITFEVNGESYSFFIPEATLKSKSKSEIVKILDDGDYTACAICCSQKKGFALCLARCLSDGKCCDDGASNCS